MKKTILALAIVLAIYACSTGGNSNESGGSLFRPTASSSIDLRLGQIAGGSSPVAISAALENRESVVTFIPNTTNDIEVVYVSTSSETILVTTDQTGRPKSARTNNLLISFDNYVQKDSDNGAKVNTVDITIQFLGNQTSQTKSIFLPSQPIDSKAQNFLESDTMVKILLGIDQDIDSGIRSLLAASLGALRTLGCSTDATNDAIDKTAKNLLSKICSSRLLDLLENLLEQTGYENITVNLTGRYPECDNPQSFEEKSTCSLSIGLENALAAPKPSNSGTNTGSSGGNITDGSNTGSSTDGNTTAGTTAGDSTGTGGSTGGTTTGNTNGGTTAGDSTGTGGSTGGTTTGSTNGGTTTGGNSGGSTGGTTSGGTTGGTNGGTSTGGNSGGNNDTGFTGRWVGRGSTNGTAHSGCSTFSIDFNVSDQGDPQCGSNFCSLTGSFSENKVPVDFAISGRVFNSNGNYIFSGNADYQNTTISIVVTGSLKPPGTNTLFSYFIDGNRCSGSFSVTKQ